MARHAAAAIATGEIDVALLTYGSTARSDVKRQVRGSAAAMSTGGAMQFEAPYGATLIAKYAMAAAQAHDRVRHDRRATGRGRGRGPRVGSHERQRIRTRPASPLADVAAAPMLADPFTTKHVCLRTDGGGAVVLASERVARNCAKEPVWITRRR